MDQRVRPTPEGMEILGTMSATYAEVLTPEALDFVAGLSRRFEARRRELMAARDLRQREGMRISDVSRLSGISAAVSTETMPG